MKPVSWKKIHTAAFLLIFLSATAQAAYSPIAKNDPIDPRDMGKKLGRGLANTFFGWLDVFNGVKEVNDEHNQIAAVTWGVIYGLGKGFVRTAAGVYETVTFPIPIPQNYEPIVLPEFVLEEK